MISMVLNRKKKILAINLETVDTLIQDISELATNQSG